MLVVLAVGVVEGKMEALAHLDKVTMVAQALMIAVNTLAAAAAVLAQLVEMDQVQPLVLVVMGMGLDSRLWVLAQ
jgi:hypothetical protein|tara:strand:+ start:258 stop:482 length:225 start_codon:yes stop_codon:yes gene_type:complete